MEIQNGLVQALLQGQGGLHGVQGFAPLVLRRFLHVLEDRAAAALVLHLQKTLGTLAFLLRQLAEEVAHASQSHIVTIEMVAQREVSVGGPQMQTDQAVDTSLHLGGIILMNVRGWARWSQR
jgi:hypothetical protein